MCQGSSDPFYIVSYYIKWVTTYWTHSKYLQEIEKSHKFENEMKIFEAFLFNKESLEKKCFQKFV